MSFFKKMTDKFDDLIGDKDKKKEEKHDEGTKNEQYQAGPQYGNYGGAPPPQQPQFSSGPPQLPPGWISQWDPNSQRYYYLEQASGRTQWEMPQHYQSGGPPPFQGQSGAPQMGGMGGYQAPGYAGQAPGYAGQPGQYQTNEYKDASGTVHKEFKDADKKKDKGHGGMLAAGAGGLAVGAIGGAVVANAMDDSDDEHHNSYAAPPQQQGGYPPQQGYSDQPQFIPPPAGEAGSISSSDKESIEEARKEYEEASSESDREEAREEYNEDVEEAYD